MNRFLDHVARTVAYVEQNIKNSISLDLISEEVHLSKFYLNRIFSVTTGQTLMAYVSSRKLMSSLDELLYTNMRVLDIACEYGFVFENSFIRAFKREFGITPDQFRKTKQELTATPIINMAALTAVGENSVLTPPDIIVKPGFTVIGSRCYVDASVYLNTSQLTDFSNNFFDNKLPLIKNAVDRRVYYGHNLPVTEELTYYTACAEVSEDEPVPEGMVKIQIPSNKYMRFKYAGFHNPRELTYADFAELYKVSYKWLPFEPVYHLEKIDERDCTESYCEMSLYFPISNESKKQ